MPPLYLVQQNTKIRIRNRRLQVEDESKDPPEVLTSIPVTQVDQVVLFGNIGLTTPAIDTFLGQNTEVVFLSQRGEFRGRLVGSVTPHVPLRRAQYACTSDHVFSLELAKCFVAAKLQHQRTLLLRHNRERRDAEITAAAEQIKNAIEAIPARTTHSSLMGAEGSATASYFRGLRRLFDPAWKFNERNRRPPRDPVNVLLSFGYTLLAEAASAAVQTVGLDPYAGFLHEVSYNRPALALDLMEEFRPVVDGVVLWCLKSGQVAPDEFSAGPTERPIVLSSQGQRRFLQAFEQRMETRFTHPLRGCQFPIRQCLIEQARQMATCITGADARFQPMGFK